MKLFCLAPWMPTKNSIVKKIDTLPSWYQRRQADPSIPIGNTKRKKK